MTGSQEGPVQISIDAENSVVQHATGIAIEGIHSGILLREQLRPGGPPRAWYPVLRPQRPLLSVTLHTDSLAEATGQEAQARDWLAATGGRRPSRNDPYDIDLKLTAPRHALGD